MTRNKEDEMIITDTVETKPKERLKLNNKKTELVVVSRNNECPQVNIFINGNELKQLGQFKFLAFLIK